METAHSLGTDVNEFEQALTLQHLQSQYPDWTVGHSEAGIVWQAITKPTPSSEHILIGRTLEELAARLNQSQTAQTEHKTRLV